MDSFNPQREVGKGSRSRRFSVREGIAAKLENVKSKCNKQPFNPMPDSSWQQEHLPPDLQAIARAYANQPVPRPSPGSHASMMQRLLAEATYTNQHKEPVSFWHTLAVARWRAYLLGPWFWIIGIPVLLVGGLLAPNGFAGNPGAWLILLLPLTTVFSLAYALRTSSAGLRAVEASCPVNFVQTTIGLALAILAFDILLGLVTTLFATLVHFAPFWNLLLAWLAPVLLLTAISLPLALLRGLGLAMLVGGLPWLFLGFSALTAQNASNWAAWFFALPQDTLALLSHLVVIAFSLVFLTMLLFSAPRWQRFCTF